MGLQVLSQLVPAPSKMWMQKSFFEILTRNKCSINCPEIDQDPIHSVSEIFSYTYSSQKTNILNNYMLSMWALYAKYGFCHRINDKGLDYNAQCLISSCEIWRHFLIPMGISSQQTRTNMQQRYCCFCMKFKKLHLIWQNGMKLNSWFRYTWLCKKK